MNIDSYINIHLYLSIYIVIDKYMYIWYRHRYRYIDIDIDTAVGIDKGKCKVIDKATCRFGYIYIYIVTLLLAILFPSLFFLFQPLLCEINKKTNLTRTISILPSDKTVSNIFRFLCFTNAVFFVKTRHPFDSFFCEHILYWTLKATSSEGIRIAVNPSILWA